MSFAVAFIARHAMGGTPGIVRKVVTAATAEAFQVCGFATSLVNQDITNGFVRLDLFVFYFEDFSINLLRTSDIEDTTTQLLGSFHLLDALSSVFYGPGNAEGFF